MVVALVALVLALVAHSAAQEKFTGWGTTYTCEKLGRGREGVPHLLGHSGMALLPLLAKLPSPPPHRFGMHLGAHKLRGRGILGQGQVLDDRRPAPHRS